MSVGVGPTAPIANQSGRPASTGRSGPTDIAENAPGGIACPSGVVTSGADQSTGFRYADLIAPAANTGPLAIPKAIHANPNPPMIAAIPAPHRTITALGSARRHQRTALALIGHSPSTAGDR